MYRKYDLYADCYTMTGKGMIKIVIKNLYTKIPMAMSDYCAEVIYIHKYTVCKKCLFSKCNCYSDSEKHVRYIGQVNCAGAA